MAMLARLRPASHVSNDGQKQLVDLRAGAEEVVRTADDQQHAAPGDGEREAVKA
jgi:hypothetical protein